MHDDADYKDENEENTKGDGAVVQNQRAYFVEKKNHSLSRESKSLI